MTTVYGTQVTAYYLAAVAAFEAGGAALNIAGGTLVVGDGGGSVPSISALIAANGVTHEVWRGATIDSVAVDASNPDQLDIMVEVPAAVGGVEVGPFYVYEFAILDALGNCCVVGTTNMYKSTSGSGMTTSLTWVAAIVYSVAGSVTVTPPSASYTTLTAVIAGWNANLPTCTWPLTKSDATSGGWIDRTFGLPLASQPAGTTLTQEKAAIGATRAATNAEFAAGLPESGAVEVFPYPTLQQIAGARHTYFQAQAQRASSVAPTALTNGAWATWALNASLINTISGATLNTSTGQIGLPAGTYKVSFGGVVHGGGLHNSRLRNVTAGATLATGLSCDSYGVGSITTNDSRGQGVFTLTASSVLELDQINWVGGPAYMGDNSTGYGNFVDADILIEKIG